MGSGQLALKGPPRWSNCPGRHFLLLSLANECAGGTLKTDTIRYVGLSAAGLVGFHGVHSSLSHSISRQRARLSCSEEIKGERDSFRRRSDSAVALCISNTIALLLESFMYVFNASGPS